MKQFLILILITGFVGTAQASKKQKMAKEMSNTLLAVVQSLPEATNDELASEWPLKRFLLRTQLKYGIEIPIFAKFELVPELEMVFLKE